MYTRYKDYIEGSNDDEEFDENAHCNLINSEIKNFNITNLTIPKTKLNSKQIELYFCHCTPGRNGQKHLEFCAALDEDNEIDGHPFISYLKDRDCEKYFYLIGQAGDDVIEFKKRIKNQIKTIINK